MRGRPFVWENCGCFLLVSLVGSAKFFDERSLFQLQPDQQGRHEDQSGETQAEPGVQYQSGADQLKHHRKIRWMSHPPKWAGTDKLVVVPNFHMQTPEFTQGGNGPAPNGERKHGAQPAGNECGPEQG